MCLKRIQPTINLSPTIPRSMSARYQYGISVAEACKVSYYFLHLFELKDTWKLYLMGCNFYCIVFKMRME